MTQDTHGRRLLSALNDHDNVNVSHIDPTGLPRMPGDADRLSFHGTGRAQTHLSGGPSSSINRPRWQPDCEVTACPVCKEQFTWYFRKHHCRKCGQVVCTNCSQNKITIPRQFVVQPPHQLCQDSVVTVKNGIFNLPGAENVRVCDSCVPDSNSSHPRQSWNRRLPRHSYQCQSSGLVQETAFSQETLVSHSQPALSNLVPSNVQRAAQSSSAGASAANITSPQFNPSQQSQRQVSLSGAPVTICHRSEIPSARETSHADPRHIGFSGYAPSTQGYRQRPRLAEEDECPVCGNELPPRNASDEDSNRARHIDDCIRAYGSYPARPDISGPSAAPTSLPNPAINQASTFLGHVATRPSSLESVIGTARSLFPVFAAPTSTLAASSSSYSQPVQTLQRRQARMLEYKANEKDCVDDRGEQQECVICLEEFDVGDDLGRLECMCKFHKRCILAWWRARESSNPQNRNSSGCPTHVLQI